MAIRERDERAKLLSIYREWQAHHISRYTRWSYALAGSGIALAIPFDYLFFGAYANVYLVWRLVLLVLTIGLAFLQSAVNRSTRLDPKLKHQLMSYFLTLPLIMFNIVYAYFLVLAPEGKMGVVLTMNFLIVFLSAASSYRFFAEQYRINMTLASIFAVEACLHPRYFESALELVMANLLVALISFAMRREFVGALFDKYKGVRLLAPEAVARHIVVAEGELSMASSLVPRERYTVCVMSDWRDYQQLAAKETPAFISDLFRTYYELVYDQLERDSSQVEYYASWNADELCVAFFGDDAQRASVERAAMTFVGDLTGSIYDEIGRRFGRRLQYDVGVAAGMSLVGLLGPRQALKTTLVGPVPGVAKRLEQHAKQVRLERGDATRPLVAIVRSLATSAQEAKILSTYKWFETTASVKDINGQTVIVIDASQVAAAVDAVVEGPAPGSAGGAA